MLNLKIAIALCVLWLALPVHAAYRAVGPVKGDVCIGFGFTYCSMKDIDAVEDKTGAIIDMPQLFEIVTEYKEIKGKGYCYVRTRSTGGGIVAMGANFLTEPKLFKRGPAGSLERIKADYLAFQCVRT